MNTLEHNFNIILQSTLSLASGIFHSVFPTKTLYEHLLIHATCPARLILLDFVTRMGLLI